jgi:inner membrane protein
VGIILTVTPHINSGDSVRLDLKQEVSALASNAQAQYREGGSEKTAAMDAIGLSLVEPVDLYSKLDRASKYGLLFVLLTFVGFFMFETIRQLPIHPIQYLLVGLALAIFFLLLLGLSEHIAFGIAYLAASIACIGLLGFYLAHVLRSRARGVAFAAMLGLLYAALYGLLLSEDNALVLGSVLLFAILAAIMVATRKVDWYQVAARAPSTVRVDPTRDYTA